MSMSDPILSISLLNTSSFLLIEKVEFVFEISKYFF